MEQISFKIIRNGNDRFHVFCENLEETLPLFNLLVEKFPRLLHATGFSLVGGLMTNINLSGHALNIWSDSVSAFVHSISGSKDKPNDAIFAIVSDDNGDLVLSPLAELK